MLSTLPIGQGPGTGITSPRSCRWACATGAELSKPAFSSRPARRIAVLQAGITPPFTVIARTLSAAPSVSIGMPTKRRLAIRNQTTSA